MSTSGEQLDKLFNEMGKKKKGQPTISTFRASDVRISSTIPYGILSRIPQLDIALGRPGYPAGRIIELFGLEQCGKTTAALMAMSQIQRMGGSGLFIDAEYAFDSDRAEELGVDVENLRLADKIESIEDIFRTIIMTLDGLTDYTKPFGIIVDSVTSVPTEWEIEKNKFFDSSRPGYEAIAIKRGIRSITGKVAKKKVVIFFINHAHETMAAWGKKVKSGGGHGIKFAGSARVGFKHAGELKDDDNVRSGQNISIWAEKIKGAHLKYPIVNPPVPLLNDGGFDTATSLLEAMIFIKNINHPKGSQTYTWNEVEFKKADWPAVIADNGGLEEMYRHFIEQGCIKGYMKPYSSRDTGDANAID